MMSGRTLLWLWLGALMLFAIVPGLDLVVARLFFSPVTGGFPLGASGFLDVIRNLIWGAANLMALTAMIFGLHAALTERPLALPGQVWAFAFGLILLAPVALVNWVLKATWGRARPADLVEFGGTAAFTPPWQIAQECARNCSFVSGEAAAAVTVAVLLGVFLWQAVPPARRRHLFWALVALAVIGASMRVMKGRHFLSDVIWSAILTVTIARGLWHALGLRAVQGQIRPAAFAQDARALGADLAALARRAFQRR